MNELNILILGESGIGKSTFINAFINYITYDNLDGALQNETLNWLIPCSFNVQNMDRSDPQGRIVQTNIKIGEDASEVDGASGDSATKETVVYPIAMGDNVIRLIDTPGIGDTEGIEQDKKNCENILAMLRNFDKIHGILFLLKSNTTRLNVVFKFVVKELLSRLHRDAASNMVFGFTNTRGSNYSPGDALGPLQRLLQENKTFTMTLTQSTVYCFDSEAFRFLAATKKKVEMSNCNIQDFRSSWDHSSGETQRLLKYFRALEPHNVRSTLSLNSTRDRIGLLTRPMAEIMQSIEVTIARNTDNIKEIEEMKLKGNELRKRLRFEKVELDSHVLDRPQTVCNDAGCKEYRSDAEGQPRTIYKSHCHKECYLKNVPPETLSCSELLRCAAFQGQENCRICGHHWENHLHVLTELEPVVKTVDDHDVQERINKNASDIDLRRAIIQNLENKIQESDYEYAEIQKAAVRFAAYLKKYSITPYNDAMLAYLDHLIKEEAEKVTMTGKKRDILDNLLKTRYEHVEQVKVLTMNMENGDESELLDENGVEDLVQHLYKLPHWGKNLRDMRNTLEEAHAVSYREKTYRPHGRPSGGSRAGPSSQNNNNIPGWMSWMTGKGKMTTNPVREIPQSSIDRRVSVMDYFGVPGDWPEQSRNQQTRPATQQQHVALQKAKRLPPLESDYSQVVASGGNVVQLLSSAPSPHPASEIVKANRGKFSKLLRPFSKRY